MHAIPTDNVMSGAEHPMSRAEHPSWHLRSLQPLTSCQSRVSLHGALPQKLDLATVLRLLRLLRLSARQS